MSESISRDRIAGFVSAHLHVSMSELRDDTVLDSLGGDVVGLLDQCIAVYRPKNGLVVENRRNMTFGALVALINA